MKAYASRTCQVAALLFCSMAAPAAPAPVFKPYPKHSTRGDWERLLGDWECVSYEVDGGPAGRGLIIRINKQGVIYTDERMLDNPRHPLVIDAIKQPKRWDISNEIGIYELEDDTLTICTTGSEKETDRPRAFTTEENSGRHLQIFKRMPR